MQKGKDGGKGRGKLYNYCLVTDKIFLKIWAKMCVIVIPVRVGDPKIGVTLVLFGLPGQII